MGNERTGAAYERKQSGLAFGKEEQAMKPLVAASAFLLLHPAPGQNLVPNASFEVLDSCPEYPSNIGFAVGWTSFRGSPDLYNSCNESGWCDVPLNAIGYQFAADGQGYAGVITYRGAAQDDREYLGAQLTEQVQPGDVLYLSMKIAVAGYGWYVLSPRFSASGVGMFFSTAPWSTSSTTLPNWAALSCDTVPTDTLDWIVLSGQFVSDSAYSYVVIGNPFEDSLIDTLTIDTAGNLTSALAFVDEIFVSRSPVGMGLTQMSCEGLRAFPNPCMEKLVLQSNDLDLSGMGFRLTDVSGRVLDKGQLTIGPDGFTVDTSRLPEGSFALLLAARSGVVRGVHFIHHTP